MRQLLVTTVVTWQDRLSSSTVIIECKDEDHAHVIMSKLGDLTVNRMTGRSSEPHYHVVLLPDTPRPDGLRLRGA